MSFLNNVINEFTHSGSSSHHSSGGGGDPPPQVPPPWRAVWDERDQRWLFINEQNGERTFQFPQQGSNYGGGQYGGGGYGGPPREGYGGGYGGPSQQGYDSYGGQGDYYENERREKKHGHGMAYGVGGAAVGLAGGALLMHEGEKLDGDWDREKYKVEQGFEDAPERAARWVGEGVQGVEDIPQDIDQGLDRFGNRIENRWDNAVDDVEDFPENTARWTGEKVQEVEDIPQGIDQGWDRMENRVEGDFDNTFGGVERFGDRMDGSYDQGRYDERQEDRYDD
ncbi:hypothetical protein LTS18_003020 [Coniosporium uncinatum]|uniref:Uncharacterized protein n=1 Tax=Coniosporium uncinatum TaxID=93489 RepID=A0ACC3D7M9_9PEZI|nr:hypothetical protein LTS18_003020 [Coniosporium uncinatum]